MSTFRTARVTVDGVEAALRTERGGSYTVGHEHLPFEVHVLTLRGAPWCTVAVHRRPGAEVAAELAPGPGPRAKAPEARRAVEVRFWLTPEEASRVGLAGAGRNEAARARLLTPEVELAELFSARTSPVPEDVRRLCVVAGELASRAAPRVIRELCRRLAEAEARLAGSIGGGP